MSQMSHFMISSRAEDHIVIIYLVSRMCNFMITATIVSNLIVTIII